MSAKQAINDKLQGSVATYLRYSGVVNNQIKLLCLFALDKCSGVVNNQIKKGLLLSLSVKFFFKSVHIWQSYKQERDCLVPFLRLLAMCWTGAQSV